MLPPQRRSFTWRAKMAVVTTGVMVLGACGGGHPASRAPSPTTGSHEGTPPNRPTSASNAPARTTTTFGPPQGPGSLASGSDPSVLPGPLLIADRDNNRLIIVSPRGQLLWEFPRPGDLGPGQTFSVPDDAFFSPDGREVIATQEDDFAITIVDIASHRIVYRYGTPGVYGSGPEHLWNPDDAMLLPDGSIVTADIKNCRLLVIGPGGDTPSKVIGETTSACRHDPPRRWGSPNGAFPMANGDWLVTEINGDWVDELTPTGTVLRSWHPPGLSYPSDSNEISPGVYLSVDYSSPGVLETFDGQGNVLWRYSPVDGVALDHPSLALPLPNGDVILNDDRNERVIVVDPHTNRVVWQYGETGRAGSAPGLLANPDGIDLAAPWSLLARHAPTLAAP